MLSICSNANQIFEQSFTVFFKFTTIIPTEFVLFIISAIIGSGVIYKDFDQDDPALLVWFILSCVTEFFGVYFITTNKESIVEDVKESLTKNKSIHSNNEEQQDKSAPLLRDIPSTSSSFELNH